KQVPAMIILLTVTLFTVSPGTTDTQLNDVIDQYFETFKSHISGEEYEIIKNISEETVLYKDQKGNVYRTKQEIFDKEIKDLSIDSNLLKLDEDLREIVKSEDKNKTVPVIVVLVRQPAQDISIKVREEHEPEFKNVTEPARKVYDRIKPRLREEELHALNLSELINAEQALLTAEEKRVLNETGIMLERQVMQMRHEILARTEPEVEKIQTPIVEEMERNGCEIKYNGMIYNSIIADVPVSYLAELAADSSIAMVYYDKVLKATVDISAQTIGADYWWDQGYRGGIWDVAVVDSGIDSSHPALSVDYAKVFHKSAQDLSNYADDPSNPDDLDGHGTSCAGIIASEDSTYKGVAHGLDKLINAKAGYLDVDGGGHIMLSDRMEAIDWAILHCSDGADVISHSYTHNPGADGDTGSCHYMDAVIFSLNVPVVISAGNTGPDFTTVCDPGSAYNVITVGAIDDKNTVSRDDDSIRESSSRGPTGDGRLKPDIVAPGKGIRSCNNEWEVQSDFVSNSGTSFAAPHIAGSVLLILDYKGIRWDAKAIKALLLNTAENIGASGPDNTYGFGYVDLKKAYIHRDNVHIDTLRAKPEGEVEKFYKGQHDEGDRTTLVWNRHVIYDDTNSQTQFDDLSNLDLYIYNETDNRVIDSSISYKNNVEQVKSLSYHSSAIIKIEPFGLYPTGIYSEEYAMATEGNFSEVAPPELCVNLSIPSSVSSDSSFTASLKVTNTGDLKAHDVNATLNGPSVFTRVFGANPQNLGMISGGENKTVTWTVNASSVSSSQDYIISADVDSSSYGEYYTASDLNLITVTSHPTIQSKIDAASPGDTIIIKGGSYQENVRVDKRLTIRSDGDPANCIIHAASPKGYVFEITSDYVNIIGFKIDGASDSCGIYICNANNCNISNNIISGNYQGIYLSNSWRNTISRNNVFSNKNYGIILTDGCCHNQIINNKVSSNLNYCGIYLRESNNNDVHNNSANYNHYQGIELRTSNENMITNNMVKNNGDNGILLNASGGNRLMGNDVSNNSYSGILLNSSNNNDIGNSIANYNYYEGIELWRSNENIITNNTVKNNGDNGIYLEESNDNKITDNIVSKNDYNGIVLGTSNNSEICNNIATYNHYQGIGFWRSNENIITNNTVKNNGDNGIYLEKSNNNKIYLINFMDNANNVYSTESTNVWNTTSKITYTYKGITYTNYLGNYWDDYKEKYPNAEERDSMGIWDTPYRIDSDSDQNPLVVPCENFAQTENVFETDLSVNPYPSISGTHTGMLTPNIRIEISTLYTYSCAGTGGHTKYARIWNDTWSGKEGYWEGYTGDWHNLTFDEPFNAIRR
ncbi:CASH domain-dontaining protein, partial [Candidatus Methanophagaceae archaeon]